MKVNDIENICVVPFGNYNFMLSTVYNNKYIQRQYIGYTKTKAIRKFKEFLKRGVDN